MFHWVSGSNALWFGNFGNRDKRIDFTQEAPRQERRENSFIVAGRRKKEKESEFFRLLDRFRLAMQPLPVMDHFYERTYPTNRGVRTIYDARDSTTPPQSKVQL
jgi:hypothetical protein